MSKLNPLEFSTKSSREVNIALAIRVSEVLFVLNELALAINSCVHTFLPHHLNATDIGLIS